MSYRSYRKSACIRIRFGCCSYGEMIRFEVQCSVYEHKRCYLRYDYERITLKKDRKGKREKWVRDKFGESYYRAN
jgi:hypothetical protein